MRTQYINIDLKSLAVEVVDHFGFTIDENFGWDIIEINHNFEKYVEEFICKDVPEEYIYDERETHKIIDDLRPYILQALYKRARFAFMQALDPEDRKTLGQEKHLYEVVQEDDFEKYN